MTLSILKAPGDDYTIRATYSPGKGNLTTIGISVNGTSIGSQAVSGAGVYDVPYHSSDPFTATVTVTDDLYYTGTDTQTKN